MAYWINEFVKGHGSSRLIAFYADDETDVQNLPTSAQAGQQQGEDTVSNLPCANGSKAFVIATGETYYLDSSDNWVLPGSDG